MFKINIYRKIMFTILLASIVPLVFLSYITIGNFNSLNKDVYDLFGQLGKEVSDTAIEDMEYLGEKMIQEKARDIAGQAKLFIENNSKLNIAELQNNKVLMDIALSKVGETGYCCLYECGSGIMRIHPNLSLVNKDMSFLKESLPTWWNIFEPSLECKEVSGYYDWRENDGTIRQKYMTMTPVKGTKYMIAATTYIDEFSEPAVLLNKKINNKIKMINDRVDGVLSIQEKIIFGSIIITLFLVLFISLFLAKKIITPILKLKNASKLVSDGNMNIQVDIKSEDEIGELADYFNIMIDSLRKTQKELRDYSEQLEEKVEKRTHELQEKLEELKKFNEIAVNRELKMVKLKKDIEDLKENT